MRYQTLILNEIEQGIPLRELARKIKLPPPSLHNYAYQGTEPRMEALQKMSVYFGEPVSMLLSEDDDLTAQILGLVRRMDPNEKQDLLKSIKERRR